MLDCQLVAGDFDYFLKIRVGDMADFNRIHGEQLIALPGVRQPRSEPEERSRLSPVARGALVMPSLPSCTLLL